MEQAVDWFVMIADLRRLGITRPRISKELGVSISAVNGWYYYSQPVFSNGEKLIDLWRRETGGVDVPRVARARVCGNYNGKPFARSGNVTEQQIEMGF